MFTMIEMMSSCSWFIESAKVYSPLAFSKLVSCTFILSCVAFQMDLVFFLFQTSRIVCPISVLLILIFFSQQLQNLGYGVIILLIAIVSNISTLFVYCYFGKLATDSFSDMSYRLFESNWQQLPLEMQKFFVLMIGNAQKTLHYHGLQIVRLDWETFTKVCTGSKFKQEKLCI